LLVFQPVLLKLQPLRLKSFVTAAGIVFVTIGIIWAGLAVSAEGSIYLLAPSVVNLLTGILVFAQRRGRYLAALAMGSSLYNLVLVVYQALAAIFALVQAITVFYIAATIVYLFVAAFLTVFTFGVYSKSSSFGLPIPRRSEEEEEEGEEEEGERSEAVAESGAD
jgi:hypothetical protein